MLPSTFDSDPICFGHIKPVPNFTGRLVELRYLDEHCDSQPYIVVIHGLGGIGKTQLVRMYAENQKLKYQWNIVWIHSASSEKIQADFESLAKDNLNIMTCNIEGERKDFGTILREVLRRLCKLSTLIVLDNVDEETVQHFVLESVIGIGTSQDHRLRYIITSRINNWPPKSMHVKKLRGFTDEEAVQLVTDTLNDEDCAHNDSPEDIRKLVAMLQNFPLTLRQAVAHINFQREVKKISHRNVYGRV